MPAERRGTTRRPRLGRRLAAAAVAAVAIGSAGAAPASATGPTLPLGSHGRWITDAEGRVFVTHGQNRVDKRPPYAPDGAGFDEADAAFLAAEGYNSVRLGVIWTAVEPQPGRYDDAYLARIERTVDLLHRHGIVSVLDFHQDMVNERYQGQGFPDWAAIDDGGLNLHFGFPNNQFLNPALLQAYDSFWSNRAGPGGVGLQDRYADAWRHVAARFRAVPGVAGYDLINEPWPGSTFLRCIGPAGCVAEDAQLHAFTQRVSRRIRTVDPRTPIWFEPYSTFNSVADTTMPPIGEPRAVLSFHAYCTAEGVTLAYDPSCEASDRTVFDRAERRSALDHVPAVLSEFGATNDLRTLDRIVRLADERMVGWQHWAYTGHDPTTQASGDAQSIVLDDHRPPTGDNVVGRKLEVLSRPYPQVVAGTPRGWSYERDARTFRAGWTTARVGGGTFPVYARSEIAIPRRQYPAGYGVRALGAAVVSPPGAPVLELATCPGAGSVSVTVTRGGPSTGSCALPAPAPAPTRLRLTLAPRRIVAGVATRVTVRVRARVDGRLRAVPGARVRLAGRSLRTDASGRARLRVRIARAGRRQVRVTAPGHRSARATLIVRG